MPTSSITKEIYVKDKEAFDRLKQEIDEPNLTHDQTTDSPSLKKSREKLSTFDFR